MDNPETLCLFCGQPETAEVLEVWGHDFMLDTCCEHMHEAVVDFLNHDPRNAGKWIGQRLSGLLPGQAEVRRVADDGLGRLILDYQLRFVEVTFKEVCQFVEKHHRHCAPPRGWRWGIGVVNGTRELAGGLLGVLSCGRPVARALDQERIVEVNRLCIDPTIPQALVWNAASQLYGWAAREAKRRGAERIITYTLLSEPGTSLRAAGWTPDHICKGRHWDTPSRRRGDNTPTETKVRWHRQLVSRPVSKLKSSEAKVSAFLRHMETEAQRNVAKGVFA